MRLQTGLKMIAVMIGELVINFETCEQRCNVEKHEEWHRWCEEIPELQFPSSWKVKIIPPFGGAIVRFRINDKISVYLDCYDALGFMGEPYWEIYPYCDDIWRCPMNNTDDLIAHIDEALEENMTDYERGVEDAAIWLENLPDRFRDTKITFNEFPPLLRKELFEQHKEEVLYQRLQNLTERVEELERMQRD